MSVSQSLTTHAQRMDATYRRQRLIYDITRKFFLLGRDYLINNLDPPPGGHVLEIACGTGRNLALIRCCYPGRRLYGLDISGQMLRSARGKLGRAATLARADACDFDAESLFGTARFDRIVLSYCLSMIPDWKQAVCSSLSKLAPGGQLHVVDFGEQEALPEWFSSGLHAWLGKFGVEPRPELRGFTSALRADAGVEVEHRSLYAGYAQHAVLSRPRAVPV